jgi:resuscitation-promoting factor RpfB
MHFSRKTLIISSAIALVIIIGLTASLGLRKTISFSVDGQSRTITTYALKVGALLRSQSITFSPSDKIAPSVDTWLRKDETISMLHAVPVQILSDGKITSGHSAERTPSKLLTELGIGLHSADLLLSNGRVIDPNQPFPAASKMITLQLVRSASFTLSVEGKKKSIVSTAPTLGSALWAAGYPIYAADQLNPPADSPLSAGLEAKLQPSRQITIQTQASSTIIRTAAQTVGEALQAGGFSVQGLDYSVPSPQDPIPTSGIVRLVRITETVSVEQSPISFETEYQQDPELEIDNQTILQTGEYGLSAQRVRVRYMDGQEVSRQVDSQWVARQPQPRIIGYGTQLVMHTTTVDGVQIQYWRAVNMYATSYHPSEVGDTTASGLPLQKGVAAIDRRYVAFGTQLYIPGYGQAVAADTGGGVIGRWIDLGYSDDDYVPWHQWVTVYFLWPPPDNVVWIIP